MRIWVHALNSNVVTDALREDRKYPGLAGI